MTHFSFPARDLEPELERICEDGLSDLESVIMRFAHGECHTLSCALHHTYGCPVIAIVDVPSGHPVHSFALLPNGLGLDAYGAHEPAHIASRYAALAAFNGMTDLKGVLWAACDLQVDDWLDEHDEPEDILAEFSVIAQHMSLDLQSAYSQHWEQEALVARAIEQLQGSLQKSQTVKIRSNLL